MHERLIDRTTESFGRLIRKISKYDTKIPGVSVFLRYSVLYFSIFPKKSPEMILYFDMTNRNT